MISPKPLRVLHIVHSLEPGGMENGIVTVSRALEARGHEIHVCCLAGGGKFVGRFPRPERVHILGKTEGISPRAVRDLAAQVRRTGPDVIHTHNLGPLIYTALAAPRAKSRTVHGEHAELTRSELYPPRKMLRRFLYSRVRRVHTVSTALRESLIGQGFPAEKICVVVNGVDTEYFSPGPRDAARAKAGLPREAIVLGLVGRFGEYKRHMELIEAFERLPVMERPVWLLFVGASGPLEEMVRERAAKSRQAERIVFAGFQEELPPWYRCLDLLVIPSVNEGLSNALLEAMACGIPALAHTACGSADVIVNGANGLLEDLSPPGALEAALGAALEPDANLPLLGEAARKTVESKFSFVSMVDGYERLYLGK